MGRRHRIDKARERGAPYATNARICPELGKGTKLRAALGRHAKTRRKTWRKTRPKTRPISPTSSSWETRRRDRGCGEHRRRAMPGRYSTPLSARRGARREQRMLVNDAKCARQSHRSDLRACRLRLARFVLEPGSSSSMRVSVAPAALTQIEAVWACERRGALAPKVSLPRALG